MTIEWIVERLKSQGLAQRDAQLTMIQSIMDAVEQQAILCVEAPTGTGKTLAYMLGAMTKKQEKQKIIISTATIALQEQLFHQDLPLLSKLLDRDIRSQLAKGRRRYVCHARLLESNWRDDLFQSNPVLAKLVSLAESRQWNGDRDALDLYVEDDMWQSISTDATGCVGSRCEYYDDCAFFKARKAMHTAEIVVVNHYLLLSDLSLGGGVILPSPEECIYILDECHHIPDIAGDYFSFSSPVMGVIDGLNQIAKAVPQAVKFHLIYPHQIPSIEEHIKHIVEGLTALQGYLNLSSQHFEEGCWHIRDQAPVLENYLGQIITPSARLLGCLDDVANPAQKDALERLSPDDKDLANRTLASLQFALQRVMNLHETCRLFCHQRQEKEAPIARWFTEKEGQFHCFAAPIYVGHHLQEALWDVCKQGAVLCSATIQALGSFKHFLQRVGLKSLATCVSVPSEFHYEKSYLVVPRMQHAPQGREQSDHLSELIEHLPQLVSPRGGSLVLFMSRSAMETAYETISDELAMDVLVQGNYQKQKLIDKHKNRVRQGRRSILFGLASFGEGLDLPGDFCLRVILHKLPFRVPSSPVEVTRNDWISSQHRNPFMLSSLPQAAIKLIQYSGRLIRQVSDQGIVIILDKRLYTKHYGKALLDSLPGFQRVINQPFSEIDRLQ